MPENSYERRERIDATIGFSLGGLVTSLAGVKFAERVPGEMVRRVATQGFAGVGLFFLGNIFVVSGVEIGRNWKKWVEA